MKKSLKIFSMIFAVLSILTVIYACSTATGVSKFRGTFEQYDSENSDHSAAIDAINATNKDFDYSTIRTYTFGMGGSTTCSLATFGGGYNFYVDENQCLTKADGKISISYACCCGIPLAEIKIGIDEYDELVLDMSVMGNMVSESMPLDASKGDKFGFAEEFMPIFDSDVIFGIPEDYESVYISKSETKTLFKFDFSNAETLAIIGLDEDEIDELNESMRESGLNMDIINFSSLRMSMIYLFENNVFKGISVEAKSGSSFFNSVTVTFLMQ